MALCNIAVELRCHILSFLSYNDIICCALTCKAIYVTVKSSAQLQYILELGAQRLIPVHSRPPTVSVKECLRILRAKASSWNSFEFGLLKRLRIPFGGTLLLRPGSITHRQLDLLFHPRSPYHSVDEDFISKVINFKACTSETASAPPITQSQDSLNPAPGTPICTSYMDTLQDLVIAVNIQDQSVDSTFRYQINFRTISTSEEHPLAPAPFVVKPGPRIAEYDVRSCITLVTVFGDRIALYGTSPITYLKQGIDWSLHVWNWHKKVDNDVTPSGVGGCGNRSYLRDIRFFTKEKLLALTSAGHIELYNVEDVSAPAQLRARFVLPIRYPYRFRYPSDFHSVSTCARVTAADEPWIWTTNPVHRVISVETYPSTDFIISARVFFMDIPPTWFDRESGDGRSIPWLLWGPQNSRCLSRRIVHIYGLGGSRVIWAIPVRGLVTQGRSFQLHMADFNPTAVARGIGRVVREPTTCKASIAFPTDVTTYLPYVEVVNDHIFNSNIRNILLNGESMLIFSREPRSEHVDVDIFDV